MKIKLPKDVNAIINQLITNGYEAYAVGGCIRDSLLGKVPQDWDITSSAKPSDVKRIFQRTVDTGISHGTVTVLVDRKGYEVTTFRIDGEYEDSRRPKSVEFTSELANDLKRRDFTINAMAYNDQEGLVDLYQGIKDLEKGIIRCVGNPFHRFNEDALRILRAFRFSAQLNFEIEEETFRAACKQRDNLKNISAERIRTELNKLLLSNHPEKIIELYQAGITKIILPEFDEMMTMPYNKETGETLGLYVIRVLKILENSVKLKENIVLTDKSKLILRWSILLHEVKNKDNYKDKSSLSKDVLRRLKFDNETIEKVACLIRWINVPFTLTPYGMRKAIYNIGPEIIELLFILKYAKGMALTYPNYQKSLNDLNLAWDLYKEIQNRGDCTSLKMLKVNGSDLIAKGYKPGKKLGEILEYLLEIVLKEPDLNEKTILLTKADEYINK